MTAAVNELPVDERIPPQNLGAENGLIGALIVEPSLFPIVAPIVRARYFHSPIHAAIYVAIAALANRSVPIDKVSVGEEMRRSGTVVDLEVLGLIGSAMAATITDHASCVWRARIVREKAALRALIAVGEMIVKLGYAGESDAPAAYAEARRLLDAIGRIFEAPSAAA